MPRAPRVDVGDNVYHVLNRANARQQIFSTNMDYRAFEQLLAESQDRVPMRVLAYCIMPNHWHLVLHPHHDGDLAAFVGWMTQTHTQRWQTVHSVVGTGHLYQNRFKSFLVETDAYFLQLCRYVERNPVRAKLVARAEDWQWSSVGQRLRGRGEDQPQLSDWPVLQPSDYLAWLHGQETAAELETIRTCVIRSRPFGGSEWMRNVKQQFGIKQSFNGRGHRDRKGPGPL